MTLFTPSIDEQAIFGAMAAFLHTILPALGPDDIVQGQDNRVSEPITGDFVVMTRAPITRLSTTVSTWDETNANPTTTDATAPTQIGIQLDVHGENSGDHAQTILTLFRSDYGATQWPAGIAPLYCDEPQQLPFLDGEMQYENRWVIFAYIQANPVVSTPAQFAATLTVATTPPADSGA